MSDLGRTTPDQVAEYRKAYSLQHRRPRPDGCYLAGFMLPNGKPLWKWDRRLVERTRS